MIKRTLSFLLALLMTFTVLTTLPLAIGASDGGQGRLTITSHADDDVVQGDRDVIIRWTAVPGAAHYHLTIKDMVSNARPFDDHVYGTSQTVPANTSFTVPGRTYKIYVAAMDAAGNVLNADWESVYVVADSPSSSEPSLVYDSPDLTSPSVKVSDAGDCYIGVYAGEIDPSEDLTLRWESTGSDYDSFTAVVLRGSPDHGSFDEAKLHEFTVREKRTSHKYTIDASELQEYQGRWMKLAIQPMGDNGDYGLLSMIYLFIGYISADEEDEPDEEPENIVIGGVDIGYSVGQYFSKSGEACTCHGQNKCLNDESECNCLRYVTYRGKTVNLLAVQCFGFSRFCQLLVYGEHDGSSKSFVKEKIDGTVTASELRSLLNGIDPGTHIRTLGKVKGYCHSLTVVSTTSKEITVADCNFTGRCRISERSYTWAELATLLNSYGGIDYVSIYDPDGAVAPDEPDETDPPAPPAPDVDQDTPVTGGSLKVTVGTATAKAGDTVELPIRITENSGFSYIRIRVKTSLAYTLRNGSVMSMTQGSSVIWHLDRDATGSFDLAYLVLQIPEDAEDGDAFTVELDVAESNNMDEETLTCTAVHGKVTIKNAIPGDANGDNTVSGKDLTRLLRFIADYDESTGKSSVDIDFAAADLNQDSKLSGIDVTRLLKILANQD